MHSKPVAIITGGTRGIGNAIAARLGEDGHAVAVFGRSEEAAIKKNLDNIREFAPDEDFLYVRGSLDSGEDRKRLVDETVRKFGRIDVLVNNAGVAPEVRADILETSSESFDRVLDINLKGPFFLTQAVSRIMVDEISRIENIRPKIVNLSSISAYTSSTARGEYCISKAGISMMTLLFADRLAEYGINVYEVRPGIIATDMTSAVTEKYTNLIEGGLLPIKRWGYPEDVANAVSALCAGALAYSTGEVINVDGGFHFRRL